MAERKHLAMQATPAAPAAMKDEKAKKTSVAAPASMTAAMKAKKTSVAAPAAMKANESQEALPKMANKRFLRHLFGKCIVGSDGVVLFGSL